MSHESRIVVAFIIATLCLPLAFIAAHYGFSGIPEASFGGVRQMFWLFAMLLLLALPVMPILALCHYLLQTYSLCYWWIYAMAAATVFATVMWPLLGLQMLVPAAGAIAGIVFYISGIMPHKGDGPPVADYPGFIAGSLGFVCALMAIAFVYVKLNFVEMHFENHSQSVIAFKSTWNLVSEVTLETLPVHPAFLFEYQKTYLGQPYFHFITRAGWLLFPAAAIIALAAYGIRRWKTA